MLSISNRVGIGFARRLISRSSSTNNDKTDYHPKPFQPPKQSFANEEFKKKVSEEYAKTKENVFTIPNILTMTRIVAAPAMGYCIMNGMHTSALGIFAAAAATDLLDGYIARKTKQVSHVGAILDPLADKLLLTTCFIAMYNVDMLPLWIVKGIVVRDLLIVIVGGAIRYYGFKEPPSVKKFMDFKNHPTFGFEPTLISKLNTVLQCLLIITHLSTQHLVGIPNYDSAMFVFHLANLTTLCISFSQYYNRMIGRFDAIGLPGSKQ